MQNSIRRWITLVEMATHAFIVGKQVPGRTLTAQLQAIGNPSVFYHSTPGHNVEAIQASGIVPMSASRREVFYGKYPDRVYLTVSEGMTRVLQRDHAKEGRSVDYMVISIDPTKLAPNTRLHHDPEDRSSYYIEIAVPASAITGTEIFGADDNTRYYDAAIKALQSMGYKASGGDDFSVSDDAILLYVRGVFPERDLPRLNAILASAHDPAFGEIVVQQEQEDWTELVGYLNETS